MNISQTDESGARVFHLSGAMTADILPELARAVAQAERSGIERIWFDMQGIQFLDSRAVGALLGWHRHFSTRAVDFRLKNVPPAAVEILKILNLDHLLNLEAMPADLSDLVRAQAEALWASHEYSEQIVNALGAGLVGLNQEGTILFVNDMAEQFIGRKEQDLIGQPWRQAVWVRHSAGRLIPPDQCPLLAVARGEQPALHEEMYLSLHAEGPWTAIHVTAKAIQSNGKAVGAVIGLLDITEHKREEERIAEREAFNFALFQHNPLEIIIVDREGRVVKSNKAMRQSGRPLPGLGQIMFKDYDAEYEVNMHWELIECIRTGRAKEFPDQRCGGRYLTVAISPFAYGAIIALRDVTETRKAAERMARLNECFMSLGPDSADNINRLVALGGHQLGAACAFYYRLAGAQLQAIGRWNIPLDAAKEIAFDQSIAKEAMAWKGKAPFILHDLAHTRLALQHPDDCLLKMQTFVGQVVKIGDKSAGVLCAFFRDQVNPCENDQRLFGVLASAVATEEKRWQAEKESLELQENLRLAQRIESLGRLATGVAHDFNNLLTVMSCSSETLLTARGKDEVVARVAERINKAAASGAKLTRQLLAFGRKQTQQLKVILINDVISGLENMLRRTITESVELFCRLAPDLKAVKADPALLEQIILNLVVNARDAMPDGGRIIIETTNAHPGTPELRRRRPILTGGFVQMSVMDTGHGMDLLTRERIFEPFFTTKDKGKGTGLGLATVYSIVQQSGGFVTVESELGKGATFRIFLPSVEEAVEPEMPTPLPKPMAPAVETVLVVEDEEIIRELIVEILSKHGYTVYTANNGQEGLDLFGHLKKPIHLLLTDVVMPKMGGIELAKRIRRTTPDIKVLYTSGYTHRVLRPEEAIDPEIAFLEKPFTESMLLAAIRRALESVKA
ncbi:MAG: response regulator [Candidatus Sumerlaeota bacterium]|nr:response regulator [Candidatus Sumerlaeota bacterium]